MLKVFVQIVDIKGFSFSFAKTEDGKIAASSFTTVEDLMRKLLLMGFIPIENHKKTESEKEMLKEYSEGAKIPLEKIPVLMKGTEFQKKVWKKTRKIPYGKTISYGELASSINSSPRAVARALASNRIPLFIPCHRVVAKKSIGGFTPAISIKETLLKIEGGKI